MHYRPDRVSDLSYRGVAANVLHTNLAGGVQFDLSRPLGAAHTLRAGLCAERELGSVANASTVFSADGDGNQTRDVPLTIIDDSKLAGRLFGVYLQHEWQPTRALTLNYGPRYDQVSTVVEFLGTTNALPSDANTAVHSERSNDHEQTVAAPVGLSYRLDGGLVLGGDLRNGSGLRRGFANSAHLPICVQANTSLAHAIEWLGVGRFDVRLSALNLFDRVDQLRDGSGIGVGAPQFAPRRAVYLALSKPFRF